MKLMLSIIAVIAIFTDVCFLVISALYLYAWIRERRMYKQFEQAEEAVRRLRKEREGKDSTDKTIKQ